METLIGGIIGGSVSFLIGRYYSLFVLRKEYWFTITTIDHSLKNYFWCTSKDIKEATEMANKYCKEKSEIEKKEWTVENCSRL